MTLLPNIPQPLPRSPIFNGNPLAGSSSSNGRSGRSPRTAGDQVDTTRKRKDWEAFRTKAEAAEGHWTAHPESFPVALAQMSLGVGGGSRTAGSGVSGNGKYLPSAPAAAPHQLSSSNQPQLPSSGSRGGGGAVVKVDKCLRSSQ